MTRWLVLINVIVTTFMGIFSASAPVIANNCIQGELALTDPQAQWVIILNLLGLNTIVLTSQWLAERFGYKTVYSLGVLVFVIGSGGSGFATSFIPLAIARFIEGMGSGIMLPLGLALIAQNFPKKLLGLATNLYIGGGFAGGLGLGLPIAGYLAQFVSWRAIFIGLIPLGMLAFTACWLLHEETEKKTDKPFDLWGYLFFASFIAIVLIALTFGQILSTSQGWRTPWITGSWILAAFFLIFTFLIERRHPNPILPLTLLKNPVFSVSILALFLMGMAFFGSVSLIANYMINGLGYEKYVTGKIAMVYGCAIWAFSIASSFLIKKIPIPFLTISGLTIIVTSFFLNNILNWQTGPTQILWVLFLRGMGMGLALGPATTQAIGSVEEPLRNSAATLLTYFRQVGGTYGGTLLTIVSIRRAIFYTEHFSDQIGRQTAGYQATYQKLAARFTHLNGEEGATQARLAIQAHLKNQAYIQGINDAFFVLGIVGSIIILILISLNLRRWWKSRSAQDVENLEIARHGRGTQPSVQK
jgi:DHA2 family multidrug resistance protein